MSRLAGRESPLGTLAQSLRRLPTLLRSMEPTWRLGSPREITPAFLARHQIKGLIWDVDGTLTAYHARELLPAAALALAGLEAVAGLRHAILSNAPEWRVTELATMFPDMPVVRAYELGGRVLGRRLLGAGDTWSAEELARVRAAGGVALRKPDPRLVELAVEALGCRPTEVVMVGDQHLTDVAGANLAGVRSIKLPNPARETFPLSIRVSQRLEAALDRLRPGRRLAVPPREADR